MRRFHFRSAITVLSAGAVLAGACRDSSQVRSASGGAAGSVRNGEAAPAPKPTPKPVVLPAGTVLPLDLRTTHSTSSSRAGELVVAVLREDVLADGRVALPAGSELRGRVTAAVRAGKVKGQARLALSFGEVVVRGRTHVLRASAIDITADPQKKRDAALIGGGAGAGALIGAATGGKKGAGIGVLVGGAAGGGAVLLTRGREVELKAGTSLTVSLQQSLRL